MGPRLLLLLLPCGVLGNVGGSAGACACTHSWPREPPRAVRLPPLAPYVQRADLCPNHVTRFVLPHKRLCGLRDAPWVVELLQLWERQAAQRPLAGPPAMDRPPDGPPDRLTDRPPDGPTDGPPAPEGRPASPTVRPSPPPSPPAPRLAEGHQDGAGGQLLGGPQALLPTPAGHIHWEGGGQDPPAVGRAPLSLGLIMGLGLLGAALVGVLVCWGGHWGAQRAWGSGPPPLPETLTPLSCPIDVGLGSGPRDPL